MRRMLIIGLATIAMSATAAVAWAGIGPSATVEHQISRVAQTEDLDPIVAHVTERIIGLSEWHDDSVDHIRHTAHDQDMTRDMDRHRDGSMEMDRTGDRWSGWEH